MTDLSIRIGLGPQTEAEDLEALSRELIDDLHELEGIQTIEPVNKRTVPVGTKGTPIDWGTVMVAIVGSSSLTALINVLGNWLTRDRRRTLELTLDDKSLKLTGLASDEQQKLTAWFQKQSGLRLD